mmetsp:Transcript_19762/g.38148  ORF Transcript_19762/g.38148 Transcript_19762/m.38148 type:complete len:669 (-) Transcript_19762:190-2196(-)
MMHSVVLMNACALVILAFVTVPVYGRPGPSSKRKFTVEKDRFVLNGKPMQIKAGCIHYFRIPKPYWRDRLLRLRAMGLNAAQIYIPWNFHETEQGQYNFEGNRDVIEFIEEAQKAGLLVVLRPGPYICAEWEFGGFPYWLLKNGTITLRTDAEPYMSIAGGWYSFILNKVKPYLYSNGGPIVMVQVENEFGYYGDVLGNPSDRSYMEKLIKISRDTLGEDVVLFTTDPGTLEQMQRGSVNTSQVVSIGDGCKNLTECWTAQEIMNPPGMRVRMVSEYYTGWLTHWGEKMANTSSKMVASELHEILATNGSVTLYMAHGGTNFGFWAGANGKTNATYMPVITSYDYDSPVGEAGEHGYGSDGTDKNDALSAVLHSFWDPEVDGAASAPEEPQPIPSCALNGGNPVKMQKEASLLSPTTLSQLSPRPRAQAGATPTPIEILGCGYGLALYSAVMGEGGSSISLPGVARDRAQIFVDGDYYGTIYRTNNSDVNIGKAAKPGARLEILVEVMGRIHFGPAIDFEQKGIVGPVFLDQHPLKTQGGWTTHCLPLDFAEIQRVPFKPIDVSTLSSKLPKFYRVVMDVPEGAVDTFINMKGWGKGIVWANGRNLGRYWPSQGPQHMLYVPGPFIGNGTTGEADGVRLDIVVLELDEPKSDLTIHFSEASRFWPRKG